MIKQELTIDNLLQIRQSIKFKKPLIHCITNPSSINDCEMLSMVTGTGCMLTALIASYISSRNILDSTVLAVALMGICGELSLNVKGTGSFRTELIDNMFSISDDVIIKKIRYKLI